MVINLFFDKQTTFLLLHANYLLSAYNRIVVRIILLSSVRIDYNCYIQHNIIKSITLLGILLGYEFLHSQETKLDNALTLIMNMNRAEGKAYLTSFEIARKRNILTN